LGYTSLALVVMHRRHGLDRSKRLQAFSWHNVPHFAQNAKSALL